MLDSQPAIHLYRVLLWCGMCMVYIYMVSVPTPFWWLLELQGMSLSLMNVSDVNWHRCDLLYECTCPPPPHTSTNICRPTSLHTCRMNFQRTYCPGRHATQNNRGLVLPPVLNMRCMKRSSACHLLSRWFLARLILRPWRWRLYVPPKRRLTFNGLHGTILQKIKLSISTHSCEKSLDRVTRRVIFLAPEGKIHWIPCPDLWTNPGQHDTLRSPPATQWT
jgi:hypothetical protein